MKVRKTAVLIIVGMLGAGSLAACTVEEPTPANSQKVAKAQKKGKHRKDKAAEGPTETMGQKNARGSAEGYLSHQAFSRSGLIDQLKFEGFSKADATYAVDYISPNWNKQAAKSAKSYVSHQSFSASGLQDQLEFEGFSSSQAAAGVAAAGY